MPVVLIDNKAKTLRQLSRYCFSVYPYWDAILTKMSFR